jgi:hypothetical protein
MLQRKCYKNCTFLLYSILTRACYGSWPIMDNNTDNHCDNNHHSTAKAGLCSWDFYFEIIKTNCGRHIRT